MFCQKRSKTKAQNEPKRNQMKEKKKWKKAKNAACVKII